MRFPVSSASLNATEQRAIVQVGNYESIKAKIDRGINRQSEGRKEVQEGLREMLETKAYLKKYKTIAAFAEHEYGKSPRWVSHQLEELYVATDIHKQESAAAPMPVNAADKKESAALNEVEKAREVKAPAPNTDEPKEEAEKPAVHSADEKKQDAPKTPAKPEPVKDTSGHPIPKALLPVWERRQEIQDVITLASKLKCAVEKLQGDKQFAAMVTVQTHLQSLGNLYFQLSQCKPGVVCPNCNGSLKDDMARECKSCRLTGFISEHDWHSQWQKSNGSHQIGKVQERCNSSSATTN